MAGYEKGSSMLKVWGRRNSFNVQKVLWLVGELGLAHEHIPAGGSFGRLDEPSFRALNPHGRVPVIEDGDLAVWESHAILRYLAARYDRSGLWSADPAARARVDAWMDWSQATLQPDFLMGIFWGYYRTPERSATGPRSARVWLAAPSIFGCWTTFWRRGRSWPATGSRWRTFPPARRFIAISSSISNVPPLRT